MRLTKDQLNQASGIAGFLLVVVFGIWLTEQSSPQNLNIASWVMWTMMDTVVVILSFRAGNRKPYLFIGWAFAALLVTLVMVYAGAAWNPSPAEQVVNWMTIGVVVGSIIALLTDKSDNPILSKKCLIICAFAMFIAGVPQIMTSWTHPELDTWWLWLFTAVICTATILTSPKSWSVYNAPVFSSLIYQAVILTIMYR